MPLFPLRFAPAPQPPYTLLELPHELCAILENRLDSQFTIRGRISDDAVLCTASNTYAIRAVSLSNTFLVATAPANPEPDPVASDLVVRDQLSQILELVPAVPRIHRFEGLLRGCEYDQGHEEDPHDASDDQNDAPPTKRARFTHHHVRGEIQASDGELAQGIKALHVLEIDGHLRPLAPSYLTHILESLLNALVSQALPLPPHAVPANQLLYYLDLEHEIPRRVTQQVLPWFGTVETDAGNLRWEMNVNEVVKHIGLGRLMLHKNDPVKIHEFLEKWNVAVGDTFASSVDLALLEGNYLLSPAPDPSTSAPPTHMSYFPASALPVTPAHLFTDLFLTRPRWRAADILPFLHTVAVDGKERDKLLMKYARATTADGALWYTARATHV